MNLRDEEKQKLDQLLSDLSVLGSLQGFRYFQPWLRGREEILLTVVNDDLSWLPPRSPGSLSSETLYHLPTCSSDQSTPRCGGVAHCVGRGQHLCFSAPEEPPGCGLYLPEVPSSSGEVALIRSSGQFFPQFVAARTSGKLVVFLCLGGAGGPHTSSRSHPAGSKGAEPHQEPDLTMCSPDLKIYPGYRGPVVSPPPQTPNNVCIPVIRHGLRM
ncbi:uncharacterized protein [Phyllobates terribilis]|uniref:uncharacterized protein isoform X3 n=1 Tax=Phyllobates terribilis TaxID=111132 RepID=UPI003CCB61E6